MEGIFCDTILFIGLGQFTYRVYNLKIVVQLPKKKNANFERTNNLLNFWKASSAYLTVNTVKFSKKLL